MSPRTSKRPPADKEPITRIWIGRTQEGSDVPGADGPESPETSALLDRVVTWAVDYLSGRGLDVRSGHDGTGRTLEFQTENDCLEAQDRLVAANDEPRDFRFRFVLRPSGVTVLVVS